MYAELAVSGSKVGEFIPHIRWCVRGKDGEGLLTRIKRLEEAEFAPNDTGTSPRITKITPVQDKHPQVNPNTNTARYVAIVSVIIDLLEVNIFGLDKITSFECLLTIDRTYENTLQGPHVQRARWAQELRPDNPVRDNTQCAKIVRVSDAINFPSINQGTMADPDIAVSVDPIWIGPDPELYEETDVRICWPWGEDDEGRPCNYEEDNNDIVVCWPWGTDDRGRPCTYDEGDGIRICFADGFDEEGNPCDDLLFLVDPPSPFDPDPEWADWYFDNSFDLFLSGGWGSWGGGGGGCCGDIWGYSYSGDPWRFAHAAVAEAHW
jgi:hypothetical protein